MILRRVLQLDSADYFRCDYFRRDYFGKFGLAMTSLSCAR